MIRFTRPSAMPALVVSILATATGCATTAADKAGGGVADPIVLTIGTDDNPGRPSGQQIEHFASRVAELSDGGLRIEPRWRAAGVVPDWDQEVARMVAAGDLDLGLVPSRAFDTEGVTSLTALNAPFLITSDALVADVIRSDLADDLMSGLGTAGVIGLSMFPAGLRHPFGVTAPLTGPEDYVGSSIRSPTSATVQALFEALGATTNDEEFDATRSDGMESGYLESPDVAFATGNVTFFPKVLVLVVNTDTMDGLDPEQQDILLAAATETQDWAVENTLSDRDAALRWCRDGGTVVRASDSDVEAMVLAAEEVTRELAADPLTRRLIDEIGRRAAALTDDADDVVECVGGRTPPASTPDAQQADADFPAGVYRYELTRQDLIDAGAEDENVIYENIGIFTWTMVDGRYCFERRNEQSEAREVCGRYAVDGDTITVHLSSGVSPRGRWTIEDDGDLVLGFIDGQPAPDPVIAATVAETWRRIGDVDES